jgi:hypothetical protein
MPGNCWRNAHLKAEMQDKDAHASCDTMVANPYVNHVAVLAAGVKKPVGAFF